MSKGRNRRFYRAMELYEKAQQLQQNPELQKYEGQVEKLRHKAAWLTSKLPSTFKRKRRTRSMKGK